MKRLLFILLTLISLQTFSQSTTVVISQVYGGAGSASGTYNSDYVELHNISSTPQDISGYKIMYGSSTGNLGSSTSNIFTFPANTIIPVGGYILVATAPSTGITAIPIAADYTFTLGIGSTNGKIAFGTAAMTGNISYSAQPTASVIDFVGYGNANESEGTAVAALSLTTAAFRKNNGCTETNTNSTDFETGTPNPRNSATTPVSCVAVTTPLLSVISTLPSFGNVCVNSVAGPKSFTINGTNLTSGNVVISALDGYSFTLDTNTAYTSTLSINQTGGSFTKTIYVKFLPVAVQSYNGNILIDGGGASTSQSVIGNGIATAVVGNGSAASVTSSAATLNGSLVAGCEPTLSYGFVYSTISGFNPSTGTSVSSNNLSGTSFSSTLSGLLPSTTYYFYAYATTASSTIYASVEGSFTTTLVSVGGQGVVISQVYGGGGSASATYNADYVELHNNTLISQNIGGCKLLYGSTTGNLGSTTTNTFTFPTGTTIPAGGYLLIANNPGTGLAPLPLTADHIMTINMGGSNGKIVFGSSSILNNATYSAQPAGSVYDFVGYGTANESETSTVLGLNTTNAGFRNSFGCDDTNNNLADFSTATPAPRNSSSPIQICSVLPVKLLSFEASKSTNNSVRINWSTIQEINLARFEIERSADGRKWQSIHQLTVPGNSDQVKNYQWVDINPLQGNNYYRLRSVNMDGTYEFSAVRTININTKNQFTIFPNPAKNQVNLQIPIASGEAAQIELFNAQGIRVMLSKTNSSLINLPVQSFGRGIYQIRVTRNGNAETSRLILQ